MTPRRLTAMSSRLNREISDRPGAGVAQDTPCWTTPGWNPPCGPLAFKGRMEKTIYTVEYAQLLELLRETRKNADLTQIDLAKALGQTQSFVSKIEVGDRRLDVIQLRTICRALGTTLPAFIE